MCKCRFVRARFSILISKNNIWPPGGRWMYIDGLCIAALRERRVVIYKVT
jgi:hypothetical protein